MESVPYSTSARDLHRSRALSIVFLYHSIVKRRSVPVRREVGDDPHGVAQHEARVGGLYGAVAVHVRHGPHDLGGDLQLHGVAQHHTGVGGGDHAVKIRIAENVEFEGEVSMIEDAPEVDLFSVASAEYKNALIKKVNDAR